MTGHGVRVLTATVATILGVASVARGQHVPHKVKANVPFAFTFRDKVFPPGNYVLACTPVAVQLRNAQGEVVATQIPHSVISSDALRTPKLVFSTDTGSHVLSQIWPGAGQSGYEFASWKSASFPAKRRVSQPGAGGGNKLRQGGHWDEPDYRTR